MRNPILMEAIGRRGGVRDIARACGCSSPAVSQWRGIVPVHRLVQVARVLGVSPARLLKAQTAQPANVATTADEQIAA